MLHPNWRALLARAWSVRLIVVAFTLEAVAQGAGFFVGVEEPWRSRLAILTLLCLLGAGVARLMPQSNLPANGGA